MFKVQLIAVSALLLSFTTMCIARDAFPSHRLGLHLTDGSYIVGIPKDSSLAVETSFAKMKIPLSKIKTIQRNDDHKTIAIKFHNGDSLTGVLNFKSMELVTIVGNVSVATSQIAKLNILDGRLPVKEHYVQPKDTLISYGGLNWHAWRTQFAVVDGKLASQPKARTGFRYGHWGHGRGPLVVANIGDKKWKDYRVDFDFAMLPKNRSFDPHHMPNERGMRIFFRVKDMKESWNEPAQTCYQFALGQTGNWSLYRIHDHYIPGNGYRKHHKGTTYMMASGKGIALEKNGSNRFSLQIVKNQIKVWVNDKKIVELTDEKTSDALGHGPLRYGGIGVSWRYESMGWIKNVSVQHLKVFRTGGHTGRKKIVTTQKDQAVKAALQRGEQTHDSNNS